VKYTKEQLEGALAQAKSEGNQPMIARLETELGLDPSFNIDSRPTSATAATAVAQGATFGFLDELRGMAGEGFDAIGLPVPGMENENFEFDADKVRGYEAYRDGERDAYARYKDENPKTAFAGELVGGLVTGGAGAARAGATNVGSRVVQSIAAAPTKKRLALLSGTGAASGATGGALQGAGDAKELEDVLGESLKGAAIGGVAGAALGPVVDGVASGVQALRGAIDPDVLASRRVAAALEESGLSPDDAKAALAANRGSVLADVGAGPRGELEGVVQQPGATRQLAEDTLYPRSRAQADEIEAAVGGPGSKAATMDGLARQRSQEAPRLYGEAYAADTPMTKELEELWKSRRVQKIWQDRAFRDRAEDLAEDEGLPFDRGLFDSAEPSTMGWDYIIRDLDRSYANLSRTAPGDARSVASLRKRVMDAVSAANPKLREARQYWASGENFREAIEDGQAFFRTSADELGAKLSRMSDADKVAYRQGVRQAITDKLDSDGWTHDSAKHFRKRGIEKRFRELFDSRAEADEFFERIDQLTEQQATMNQTLRGSQTASRQARQGELGNEARAAVVDAATGNMGELYKRALALALRASPSGRGPVRDRVGAMLLESDPAQQRRILDELLQSAEMPSSTGAGARLIPPAAVLPALIAGQQGGGQ